MVCQVNNSVVFYSFFLLLLFKIVTTIHSGLLLFGCMDRTSIF